MLVFKIVFIILTIVILVLCVRVNITIKGHNRDMSVFIRILGLKISLYSYKKKAVREIKKDTKDSFEKHTKGRFIDKFYKVNKNEGIDIILKMADVVKNSIFIKDIDIDCKVATDDCAKTGTITGGIWSGLGILIPFLEKNFAIERRSIIITPDFDNNISDTKYYFSFLTRPIRVIFVLLKISIRVKKLFSKKGEKL